MNALINPVFNELWLERKLCDAVIRVLDEEFPIHKIILCGSSEYFRSLFTRWSPQEQNLYNIDVVSPEIMRLIIEFAYTGSVQISEENVQDLFIGSDYFAVEDLKQACCTFIQQHLSTENCIGIWQFTECYFCPRLKDSAYLFITCNFKDVCNSSEFLQLAVQQLKELTERDQVQVKTENIVFEAVLRWINHSPEMRRGFISLLLPKVRLALMTSNNFTINVKHNELVKGNDECQHAIQITEKLLSLERRSPFPGVYHPLARPRLPRCILLAIAGWSGGGATNCIEAFDTHANSWVRVANNEKPCAYIGAVFLNGSVYCIGGFNGTERFSSVQRFDMTSGTWHKAAPMHARRCFVSVTVLNGLIYAMGGFDGHNRHNTAEHFQPETNQWTEIASMHYHRSDASSTTYQGKVYICGGFNGNDCLSSAEYYSPETNHWTLISPMTISRSGVGVITFHDEIYAVGGFDGVIRLNSAEVYNPRTNTWHVVPSMRSPRSNFGIEVVDNCLFVAGGYNGVTTIPDVEFYNITTGEWLIAPAMTISRSALSCCVVSGLTNIADYAAPRHQLSLTDKDVMQLESD